MGQQKIIISQKGHFLEVGLHPFSRGAASGGDTAVT